MVVIWAKTVTLVAFGLQIGPGPRGQCRQAVYVVVFWCWRNDLMCVNQDQFSHFSHFRPCSPAAILQIQVILAQIVSLVAFGLQIGPGPRGQCRQVVFVVELWC